MTINVFISFSGDASRAFATALSTWLPSVIQRVRPFLSEEIGKGQRWSPEIEKGLSECGFGILCLTKENLSSPWINYEAGALGKLVAGGRVLPYLLGISRVDVKPPLSQFQSTEANKDDTKKLILDLNAADDESIPENVLLATFDKWWPELEEAIGTSLQSVQKIQASKDVESEESRIVSSLSDLISKVQNLENAFLHINNEPRERVFVLERRLEDTKRMLANSEMQANDLRRTLSLYIDKESKSDLKVVNRVGENALSGLPTINEQSKEGEVNHLLRMIGRGKTSVDELGFGRAESQEKRTVRPKDR